MSDKTAARTLFVDGPERPPITHEFHGQFGPHHVIAWDWNGGGWMRYVIPCDGRGYDCPKPAADYDKGWLSW